MAIYFGCDVGTVGVKVAVLTDTPEMLQAGAGPELPSLPLQGPALRDWALLLLPYGRVRADPVGSLIELLATLPASVRATASGIWVTGAGGRLASTQLGVPHENDLLALARGVAELHPGTQQIFEVGGEKARYIALEEEAEGGSAGIVDYELSGECAAGTGSFLDQQATRLRFGVDEVARVALAASRAAKIAGRCSVFAKTDMIHAQQKGAAPGEVLRGLCQAVARNFETAALRGRRPGTRIAFVGGVAQNGAVLQALRQVLALDGQLFTPPFPAHYPAIGAALHAREKGPTPGPLLAGKQPRPGRADSALPSREPLNLARVTLLRDRAEPYRLPPHRPLDAYLGVDVGSVSTNLVLVDEAGELIHEVYLRTQGRPVEVVGAGLREIRDHFGDRVAIRGVATTGSGRELVGELLGADAVHDEITAHRTGAFRIARRYLGTGVDTIFEIGGQDAKYIHLRDGVVVDFAMNEACAAGTGSFLEEQAEKLGIRIEGEFAELALASREPLRLGERCTVFMERDLARCQQAGAALPDLVAGLAYAVVENYLNRVVRGRPVGGVVFFQGGTAYNDAVAAAFARVLGKQIVVPPHNGVLGAYGAALLARDRIAALGTETAFRGYDLDGVPRQVRVFTCQGCTNRCDVQEVSVDGRKSYWGDKCSERFRRESKVDAAPAAEDLFAVREEALLADYLPPELAAGRGARRPTVAIPRAFFAHEQFPFWSTYLRALGFEVRLSGRTTRELADLGTSTTVAEPCFPVQAAHGHAAALLREDADHVFVPNVVSAPAAKDLRCNAYLCPWGQTFPFVFGASPLGRGGRDRLLTPTVHFQDGARAVEAGLWAAFRRFGIVRRAHRLAVRCAYRAQQAFQVRLEDAGRRALDAVTAAGRPALLLVGRPYNLYDGGLNLHIPRKLRSLYAVDVIPLDFLALESVGIDDLNPNMYWDYGRKILQASRLSSRYPGLHLLYLTNFKCGPDSYVKAFAEDAAEKPFLAIQLDGHGNDAGALTRCEAYLDSIGALRWWTRRDPSTDEPSSCPGCASPERPSSRQPCAA